MVCQSASQAKFKAHKHENGIAGRTTIIVRVIACFQPLQNCQVALLALMVTSKESSTPQMFSAWKSPDSDQMANAQLEKNTKLSNLGPMPYPQSDQNYGLPYFNLSTPIPNRAFQGQSNSNARVGEFFKFPHPLENYSYPTGNPCFKNQDSDNPVCAPQEKKFLIFDRSGNHTRLYFSPSLSPQNQFIHSATEKMDGRLLKNPAVEEKWDENELDEREGELLENSEEIDALLYSGSDNDDDDDYDYDEVTSTRHIPFMIEDGLPKRQRLLDGGYKKSSSLSFEVDDEPSYVGSRDKKVRIRETLKILGSIIPGSKNENPVSVIEKAIAYLESMKNEAKSLGLTNQSTSLKRVHSGRAK